MFDYLEFDSTFVKLFINTYNARFKFKDDLKLPAEVRKVILTDRIRNLWKK